MTELTIRNDQNDISIYWSTASEINNFGWEIQRATSADFAWEKIGWKDGKGNSNEILKYTFLDINPHIGNNYYRLKQIDFDGKFEYSDIIKATHSPEEQAISIYPNPSKDKIYNSHHSSYTQYKIYNNIGQVVNMDIDASGGIDISGLQLGIYVVEVTLNGWVQKKSFVKI
jgi:hypothetical protein